MPRIFVVVLLFAGVVYSEEIKFQKKFVEDIQANELNYYAEFIKSSFILNKDIQLDVKVDWDDEYDKSVSLCKRLSIMPIAESGAISASIFAIHESYLRMQLYMKHGVNSLILKKFVKNIEAKEESYYKGFKNLRKSVFPNDRAYTNNIFQKIVASTSGSSKYTNNTCQSPNIVSGDMFQLYRTVAVAEIKGQMMAYFALKILTEQFGEPESSTLKSQIEESLSWVNKYRDAFKTAISGPVPRHACVPLPTSGDRPDTYFVSTSCNSYIFSMLKQRSNISDNRLITAVKFENQDGVMAIRIKEGKLLPGGYIMDNKWTTEPPIVPEDGHYYLSVNNIPFRLFEDIHWSKTISDKAPIIELNLDYLSAPPGHVITGVGIVKKSDAANSPFGLTVRTTPFDFATGKLTDDHQDEKHWISTPIVRGTTIDGGASTPWSGRTEALSPQKSVNFNPKSPWRYIDTLATPEEGEYPLGGVGLRYRGKERASGFISFHVSAIDYSRYLH